MCNGKSYHIWASTQENLSSGVCEQQKLSLISAFVIRLLETRNIHFSSYNSQGCIFNIESGQNVKRPVTTRGNIGDDAAPLRRTGVNITSFYICYEEVLILSLSKSLRYIKQTSQTCDFYNTTLTGRKSGIIGAASTFV